MFAVASSLCLNPDSIRNHGETITALRRRPVDSYRGGKPSARYPHLEPCQLPARGLVHFAQATCPCARQRERHEQWGTAWRKPGGFGESLRV